MFANTEIINDFSQLKKNLDFLEESAVFTSLYFCTSVTKFMG